MTIKIEIPAGCVNLARLIGEALASYQGEGDIIIPFKKSTLPREEAFDLSEIAAAADDDGSNATLGTGVDVAAQGGIESHEHLSTTVTPLGHPSKDPTTGKYLTDHKGVMHIPAVCGNAEKPFYASGPTKGQWKRKVGVTEENYNAAYQNALNQVVAFVEPQVDTTSTASISPDAAAGNTNTNTDQSAQNAFGDQTQGQGQTQIQEQAQGQTVVTPADVFEAFTAICQEGNPKNTEAATKCFTDAGLANPSLIFSRPDLAPQIYKAIAPIRIHGA